MVLGFEVSHPVKRRCLSCNEIKFIPLNIKSVCKECFLLKRKKLIHYGEILVFLLLIFVLVLIFLL